MSLEHNIEGSDELISEEPTIKALLEICQELGLEIETDEDWDFQDLLGQAEGLALQLDMNLDEELTKRGFYN